MENNEDNICLLVRGARQVGKTYIIDEFAKKIIRVIFILILN